MYTTYVLYVAYETVGAICYIACCTVCLILGSMYSWYYTASLYMCVVYDMHMFLVWIRSASSPGTAGRMHHNQEYHLPYSYMCCAALRCVVFCARSSTCVVSLLTKLEAKTCNVSTNLQSASSMSSADNLGCLQGQSRQEGLISGGQHGSSSQCSKHGQNARLRPHGRPQQRHFPPLPPPQGLQRKSPWWDFVR